MISSSLLLLNIFDYLYTHRVKLTNQTAYLNKQTTTTTKQIQKYFYQKSLMEWASPLISVNIWPISFSTSSCVVSQGLLLSTNNYAKQAILSSWFFHIYLILLLYYSPVMPAQTLRVKRVNWRKEVIQDRNSFYLLYNHF